MGIGIEMLRYQGAERQEAPRTLHLNGQAIRVSVGIAPEPLDAVLDFYEGRCRARSGSLQDEVRAFQERSPEGPEIAASWLDTVLREDGDGRGFVACIDTGSPTETTESIAAKANRMRHHMDLSEIGDLRFVYAAEEEGDTVFVIMWTDGPFRVREMFPNEGDSPGRDVDDVPRPPDSRRLLSAWEDSQPQSMTLYAGEGSDAASLEVTYRASMPSAGWNLLEVPDAAPRPEDAPPTLVYERGERMVILTFIDLHQGGAQTSIMTAR
jgi:hypothetical protein